MSITGHLSSVSIHLDLSQFSLIMGMLSENLGEPLDVFEAPSTVIIDPLAMVCILKIGFSDSKSGIRVRFSLFTSGFQNQTVFRNQHGIFDSLQKICVIVLLVSESGFPHLYHNTFIGIS